MKRLLLMAMSLFAIVSCSDGESAGGGATTSTFVAEIPDLRTLKGLHWKTYTVPVFGNDGKVISAEVYAKPNDDAGLTDYQKLAAVAPYGINYIALKCEDGRQLCADFPGCDNDENLGLAAWQALTTAEQEILTKAGSAGCARFIKTIREWNEANPSSPFYVMLFTRQWFQDSDSSKKSTAMDDAANVFNDVISICKEGGYDDIIIGVLAVEPNIGDMDSLLPYCVEFAQTINSVTSNWLKDKVMFFPGLAMGVSFKGYNNSTDKQVVGINESKGNDTFWDSIKNECSGFMWAHKQFPELGKCPLYSEYANSFDPALSRTRSEGNTESQEYYEMLNYLGHASLKDFVARAPEGYGNVLYWGDAADGMKHVYAGTRNVLKKIWIDEGYYSGCFYHPFNREGNDTGEWDDENDILQVINGYLTIKDNAYTNFITFFDGKSSVVYGSKITDLNEIDLNDLD